MYHLSPYTYLIEGLVGQGEIFDAYYLGSGLTRTNSHRSTIDRLRVERTRHIGTSFGKYLRFLHANLHLGPWWLPDESE
jgi:hypothetical protein